ncbi:O-succinylbenzoate synthase [Halobacillus dabanensis]|uniref:o-succinylbenzoate synthase n=1 Tax=Halobacillus dabanensis TaxID=240302 RepID=A0A1I3R201_HALDA|nr:o-succinylbenzoate synthase [Halobacillus dabanensis]SFJ39276.1 O-succinylbenzoate synthase [Halobacillus dabanensis]
MRVKKITLRKVQLPLKSPFITHQINLENRPLIIVEAMDEVGLVGYGEVTAFPTPFYTYETIETAWYVLGELIVPRVLENELVYPTGFVNLTNDIQGHQMAKAGLEGALWDLYAKEKGLSLSSVLGGKRQVVPAGAVISLTNHWESDIKNLKKDGYQRYKLKVRKGREAEAISAVQHFDPSLPVMIDANGQYDEKDMDHLIALDTYGLMMIEQPFKAGDFYLHKQLQLEMKTPLCLDESVMSVHDAIQAVQLQSCRIINVKISRVGGMTAAKKIHDYCLEYNIPVWCGGMVESGISKAHNLALASLPNFTIAGDLSSSTRYFEKDLISPGISMNRGEINVPDAPGIGVDVDREYLEAVTHQMSVFSC